MSFIYRIQASMTPWLIQILSIIGLASVSSWIPQLFFIPAGLVVAWVAQGYSPWLLTFFGTVGGMLWLFIFRFLDERYVDPWLKKAAKKNKREFKLPQWIQKIFAFHDTSTNNKRVLILIITWAISGPIPDILVVKYSRKKVPLWLFIIVVFVAKFFAYLPIALGTEGLTWILRYFSLV